MLSSTSGPHRSDTGRSAIVLIDDAPFWQGCLADALQTAFPSAVILEIPNIEELYQSDDMPVALVLLKVQSYCGTEYDLGTAVRVVLKHIPSVPVAVVSARDDESIVREAMMVGAQGVIPFAAPLSVAVAALRLIMAGGTCFPCHTNGTRQVPGGFWEQAYDASANCDSANQTSEQALGLSSSSPAQLSHSGSVEPHARFTARESEVLAALQHGHPNKWIAHRLNLSENTVKFYVKQIMRKLRATNRTEAAILSRSLMSGVSRHSPNWSAMLPCERRGMSGAKDMMGAGSTREAILEELPETTLAPWAKQVDSSRGTLIVHIQHVISHRDRLCH